MLDRWRHRDETNGSTGRSESARWTNLAARVETMKGSPWIFQFLAKGGKTWIVPWYENEIRQRAERNEKTSRVCLSAAFTSFTYGQPIRTQSSTSRAPHSRRQIAWTTNPKNPLISVKREQTKSSSLVDVPLQINEYSSIQLLRCRISVEKWTFVWSTIVQRMLGRTTSQQLRGILITSFS